MTDYTTDRLHVLRGLEPVRRRATGHAEDVPHGAVEGLRADPDFVWLEATIDRAGADGEVVYAGGVAVVTRRREPPSP